MSQPSALNENHALYIVSLTINDCLGCGKVHLNLSNVNPANRDSVYMIVYDVLEDVSKDLPAVTPVGQAILLLCTLTYPDGKSLAKIPHLQIGKGSVSMSFEMHSLEIVEEEDDVESDLDETPCTSKQAYERIKWRRVRKNRKSPVKKLKPKVIKVIVERRFDALDSLDSVSYKINGGKIETLSISDFHTMFFLRPQHSQNYLKDLHQKCAGNWLKLIQSDEEGDPFSNFKESNSPFETFVKLFDRQAMQPQDALCKLAKTCLEVKEAVRLEERKFVLEVFNQVRRIFEYITANEYTVWFVVPSQNDSQTLRPMTLDDFDLTKVRTSIRAAGDKGNVFWDYTNHNIKDLLLMAFQLALASNVNQSVLVMSHLKTLAEFLTMQYVTASFMNDAYVKNPSDSKWICHCYLQRIVDMALFPGTIVIVEYPSALTLLKEGRQLIKCFQKIGPSGKMQWEVFEDVVKNNEGYLDFLKEVVNVNQVD
ncbi:LOW QUALITY PROTEIN: protein ORD [Drosophila ficusphila]|uniref:LOW QUALITY PROTEIN: protein ORD n=1 Tax=Drosophila ficusphila TaxID=30025 RepID=UPI0007E8576D|nr:LOW QUALITY PROTEIN: protein ORD [Drosophila ficusphila]